MRAGRVEEAAALAERIGKDIAIRGKARLSRINGKTDAKEMCAAVRQLTGRRQEAGVVAGITAESLDEHYAAISTNANYTPPLLKHSTSTSSHPQYVSAWQIFQTLDSLHPTATGLDQLPAWFLRLGDPLFCEPIARLFNLSLNTSTIPAQWQLASIQPVPKLARSTPTSGQSLSPQSSPASWNKQSSGTSFTQPSSLLLQTCRSQTSSLSVRLDLQQLQ